MTGLLNPKSLEIRPIFFYMILIVSILDHEIFLPVAVAFFSKRVFWRGLKLENSANLRQKVVGAPLSSNAPGYYL